MAGVIQDEAYYRDQVEPYLDGDRVTYVGSADPARRDELLGGALALLHPIAFDEPFGLSVVEAMACGTPVVAFERGSMREVVADGETGFLVRTVEEAVAVIGRGRERWAAGGHRSRGLPRARRAALRRRDHGRRLPGGLPPGARRAAGRIAPRPGTTTAERRAAGLRRRGRRR